MTELAPMPPIQILQRRDLNPKQARALTDKIQLAMGDLMTLIVKAWYGRVWLALGYDTWPDYLKGEFNHAPLHLPRDERKAVAALLRGQGMSTRAIGAAAGVDNSTIHDDLAGVGFPTPEGVPVTGLDGKTYTVTCTNPETNPNRSETVQPAPQPNTITCPTCGGTGRITP